MRKKPGTFLGFKVESYRQEDDPSYLALRLAEELHNASTKQSDADSFRTSVMSERKKAMDLQHVIFSLKERKRLGTPPSTSRMDPFNTYDLEICEKQLLEHKNTAVELQLEVNDNILRAEEHRITAKRLQRQIMAIHAKKRQQS